MKYQNWSKFKIKTIGVLETIKVGALAIVDFILPQKENVKEIENMSPEEFLKNAGKSETIYSKWHKAIFSYKSPIVKTAIHEVKYRGNKKIAKLFGKIMHEELITEAEDGLFVKWQKPIIIPVPMSPARLRERGHNQCELIGSEMEKIDGEIFFEYRPDILEKIKETKSQAKTENKKERLKNLCGSFRVKKPENIFGKDIIVIDDVTTTGATFSEIRNTLLSAGAKKVFCVAVAH